MCIARQPILDRDLKIVGYELFFRDGTSNSYPDIDPHDATSRVVLEGGLTLGIGELTNGAPAFLNCSRDVPSGRSSAKRLCTSLPGPARP